MSKPFFLIRPTNLSVAENMIDLLIATRHSKANKHIQMTNRHGVRGKTMGQNRQAFLKARMIERFGPFRWHIAKENGFIHA